MNLDAIGFVTSLPIDKIVQQGTFTVGNSSSTSQFQRARIETASEANSYGKACLARARWSTDGTSWNSIDARVAYGFTYSYPGGSQGMAGLRGAISIGCSASTVTVRVAAGYHGDVYDDGVTQSYSPIAQTFTIQYALYEVS